MPDNANKIDLREILKQSFTDHLTEWQREIAKEVYTSKQYLGPLGMIETALAVYESLRDKRR